MRRDAGHIRRIAYVRRRLDRRARARVSALVCWPTMSAKLDRPGRALYSCMLLPTGGVIDDLIAYFLTESWFRLVVNAGTRRKDLAWIRAARGAVRRRGARARRISPSWRCRGPTRGRRPSRCCGGASRNGARHRSDLPPPPSIRGSWRAPATPARMASRSCCRRTDAADDVARPGRAGREARGTRRARHAAPGSRHESIRQRHGRDSPSARVGPRLDGGVRARGARLHRARGARARARERRLRQVGLVLEERGVLRSHQVVARRRPRPGARAASARSPAAPFPRR